MPSVMWRLTKLANNKNPKAYQGSVMKKPQLERLGAIIATGVVRHSIGAFGQRRALYVWAVVDNLCHPADSVFVVSLLEQYRTSHSRVASITYKFTQRKTEGEQALTETLCNPPPEAPRHWPKMDDCASHQRLAVLLNRLNKRLRMAVGSDARREIW